MMRAVLDGDVLVSALLSPAGAPALIVRAWRAREFDLVASAAILEELDRVVRRPKIAARHGLSDEQIQMFLEEIREFGDFTPGRLSLAVIQEDLSDNRYLECAVEGNADYIVTGDRHLLSLHQYEGIEIVSPRRFLDVLRFLRHK